MTKAELREKLASGMSIDDALYFSESEPSIFKEESFRLGDEILYIPDLGGEITRTDVEFESEDEIDGFLSYDCYTGDDFVELCRLHHVDEGHAERLFQICDFRHPEDILNAGWPDKDVPESERFLARMKSQQEPDSRPHSGLTDEELEDFRYQQFIGHYGLMHPCIRRLRREAKLEAKKELRDWFLCTIVGAQNDCWKGGDGYKELQKLYEWVVKCHGDLMGEWKE